MSNKVRTATPAMSNDYNLERDLKDSIDIRQKVRGSERYAQNLYAALCNMQWQRAEVWPILRDEVWSCSWRYAGGLVADIRCEGDYMSWYCSGMGEITGPESELDIATGYVTEGHVTEEIVNDFKQLGWIAKECTK